MNALARTERLVGADGLQGLQNARVILFGVGGVGSWCAEALVRSGLGHLTLVDPDCVDISNINRQLPATLETLGRPKVEVLKERFATINPACEVTALQDRYCQGADFGLNGYDVILDAIDSLTDKANLILEATATGAEFFSAMGAALRKKLRKNKTLPSKPFLCVYDSEVLPNLGPELDPGPGKAVANGTLAHITGIFGFTLAGLAIRHILDKRP